MPRTSLSAVRGRGDALTATEQQHQEDFFARGTLAGRCRAERL